MAQKIFKSQEEIENYISNRMADALYETYDRLLDRLLQIIKEDVYEKSRMIGSDSVYNDPKFYERTYDILKRENWTVEIKKGRKRHYGTLYFNGTQLTRYYTNGTSAGYRHGNQYFGSLDADRFLEILNDNGLGNTHFVNFPTVYRPSFWDDFNDYCERWYPILFKNACKRNGIDIN